MFKILIDSNIVRRMLEMNNDILKDDGNIKIKLKKILDMLSSNKGYISDFSFFEVIDSILRGNANVIDKYNSLIEIFNRSKIDIVGHESTRYLYEHWDLFLKGEIEIERAKKFSFNAFSESFTSFFLQVSQFLILTILKVLARKDYTEEWYLTGSYGVISNDYCYFFKKMLTEKLQNSYFDNDTKIKDFIEELMKQSLVWAKAYQILSESGDEFTQDNFKKYFIGLMNLCDKKDYFKLLDCKINDSDIVEIKKNSSIDDMSYKFLSEICNDLIKHKRKIKINDLVDFLNFKNAYEHNFIYLTLDKKSLNLYKNIYSSDNKILTYINSCENLIKQWNK